MHVMPSNSIAAVSYSGPLPHPEQFQQYNLVVPWAAERILTMTEKQQSHRMMMETLYMQSQIKQT